MGQWLLHHRGVLLATILFVLFAPAALFALPLALLLAATPPRTTREIIVAAIAGSFSLAWLITAGELPDQLMRAGTVVAVAVFVPGALYTRTTVTHRALLAIAMAAFAVGNMLYAMGSSWGELQWWVGHRAGYTARMLSSAIWMAQSSNGSGSSLVAELVNDVVRFMTDYHAGIVALELTAGLVLGTAIYHRVSATPRGTAVGRLRDFRFNDQLGWVAMVPLGVVLLPKLAAARLAAANVLLVLGALYAIRGVAVIAFGLSMLRIGGGLVVALVALVALLLLPVALPGAILLGVVDSGLDIRRRWLSPRTSE
jgi:hypothetical protein